MAEEDIQKKARYDKTQNEMSSLQADTAAHELLPPEETMTSPETHSDEEKEEEEESMPSTSIHFFQKLRMREIYETVNTRERPNIFRHYHCRAYGGTRVTSPVFIMARDIIFVMYNDFYLIPFYYDEKFARLEDGGGSLIDIRMPILFVCYNGNNNSLITVVMDTEVHQIIILSVGIETIRAGGNISKRNIFPGDAGAIALWDFNIRNNIGMIYNKNERLFKFFELKNYAQLFTISNYDENFLSSVDFGSPGNMDLLVVMKDQSLAREEVFLKIYPKHTGQLRKLIPLPVSPQHDIQYLVLCGTDRIVMQQWGLRMRILDISGETSKIIKETDMEMLCRPYYLYRRNLFICVIQMGGTRSLNVFNLEGEIVVTFKDHPMYLLDFQMGSYITGAQDIMISICPEKQNSLTESDLWSINISNIFTGECIEKITAGTSNDKVRKSALTLLEPRALTYDETSHTIFAGNSHGDISIWSNKWHIDEFVDYPYDPIHNTSSEDEEDDEEV